MQSFLSLFVLGLAGTNTRFVLVTFTFSFVKLLSEITLIKFSSLGEVEGTAVQVVQ
jgi:hypothetical protein